MAKSDHEWKQNKQTGNWEYYPPGSDEPEVPTTQRVEQIPEPYSEKTAEKAAEKAADKS